MTNRSVDREDVAKVFTVKRTGEEAKIELKGTRYDGSNFSLPLASGAMPVDKAVEKARRLAKEVGAAYSLVNEDKA